MPFELQPPSEKRQTRSKVQKTPVTKAVDRGAPSSSAQKSSARPHPAEKNRRSTISSFKNSSDRPDTPSEASRTPARRSGRLPPKPTPLSPLAKRAPPRRQQPSATKPSPEKPTKTAPNSTPNRRNQKVQRRGRALRSKNKPSDDQDAENLSSDDSEDDDDDDDDAAGDGEGVDRTSESEKAEELDAAQDDIVLKTPRLKFKVSMPKVPVTHPDHVPKPRRFPSLRDWLSSDDLLSGEDARRMTEEDAKREARLRARIVEASRPGGLLNPELCSISQPDPQDEPDRQYAHRDHLVAQALHFQKLLKQERHNHWQIARRIAHAAAAEWTRRQPKTTEELLQELYKANLAKYKQVRQHLHSKWDQVLVEVNQRRRTRWEEEQQLRGKQALNDMLGYTSQLLDARRTGIASGNATVEPSLAGGNAESADDDTDSHNDDDGADDEDVVDDDSASENDGDRAADSSNMSSSQSTSEDGPHGGGSLDDDEHLTVEQLRQKYGAITSFEADAAAAPDPPPPPEGGLREEVNHNELQAQAADKPVRVGTTDVERIEPEPPPTKRREPALPPEQDDNDAISDETDDSVDMDDDMGDSDEEDDLGGSERTEDDSGTDEDEAAPGLLGFFDRDEIVAQDSSVEAGGEPDAADDVEADVAENEESRGLGPPEGTHVEESAPECIELTRSPRKSLPPAIVTGPRRALEAFQSSGDPSAQASPGTNATTKPSEMDSASSMGLHADSQIPSSITTPQPTYHLKTPIPSLLRGTLREYQHYGLDWLAGLYANGTNGILADEMGLGKTIQTIALLAHVACHHEAWGPHLIIVPTSVMLNWEMEFKKWCPGFRILTYYGSQEERRQKRKGWSDDNRWNVIVTSYQLVLQDRQAFKKRNWHYMVLDEAHNIKNFRSQRWQTLLTFKTKARLLLTGTPLQNNLTELWSLLFFLMPSEKADGGIRQFAGLKEFSGWFKRSADQILEHGRETMDEDDRRSVEQLHKVLRPYLLRRLKADVEKQMPGKHEHVVYCRLSKRQRFLYDSFMSLGKTRETLRSGNYLSIINCLMQLRKVCNHPDLFETRPIVTSFALPKAAVAEFEIKELLVRRRLLQDDPVTHVNLDLLNLTPAAHESLSHVSARESARLVALRALQDACKSQCDRIDWRFGFAGTSIDSALAYLENASKTSTLEELRHCVYLTSLRSQRRPMYGTALVERLTIGTALQQRLASSKHPAQASESALNTSDILRSMTLDVDKRAAMMETAIQKFACITPAVVATDMVPLSLTRDGFHALQVSRRSVKDPFHEARMRLSIAFPDKRLLQFDCGKLQRLDGLLRQLQAGGHRALIFTQMTKVLDILEQFLNIHGHRYLRLDGATKIEQRQTLTDRFNNDPRILVFILSSRSGGLGINLTGADTVIFYDLDWNPAMDKQCQDRCHRIGQTRDVHIYRFVSEYTIESNILRKANQKRMLDDIVIQEGEFTTDYFNKMSVRDMLGDDANVLDDGDEAFANAAMDRVLGGASGGQNVGKMLEKVEDTEDIAAAKAAEKEIVQTDDVDFDERSIIGSTTCKTPAGEDTAKQFFPPVDPSPISGAASPDRPTRVLPDSALPTSQHPPPTTPKERQPPREPEPAPATEPANDEDDTEPGHIDEYMIRFVEWELRDVPAATATDKGKSNWKGGKRGKAHR